MYGRRDNFRRQNTTKTRTNQMINVSKVRLINQMGEQVGIVDTKEALRMAQEVGLDLVEISPKADPPVCKIIDWGKYQYQQAKKKQDNKGNQKKVEIKGVRIRPNTGEGDINFKLKQVIKFLKKGDKVKVEIILRGREKMFMNDSKEKLEKFVDKIDFPFKIEQSAQKHFNGFNMIISSKDN